MRLIVVASAAFLVACSDETTARDQFANRFTCPAERVTVTPRKDLSAVALAFRPKPAPTDVAADPERLALWNKQQAHHGADYEGKSVFQVSGCNNEIFYICGQLRVSVGRTQHGCMPAVYPPN
jgi:hypothetical protein